MRKCDYCGNGVEAGMYICPHCGARQDNVEHAPAVPAPPPTPVYTPQFIQPPPIIVNVSQPPAPPVLDPSMPVYEHKELIFTLTIYPNRLSAVSRGGLTGMLFPQRMEVFLSSITGAHTRGISKMLIISLADGTFREYKRIRWGEAERVIGVISALKSGQYVPPMAAPSSPAPAIPAPVPARIANAAQPASPKDTQNKRTWRTIWIVVLVTLCLIIGLFAPKTEKKSTPTPAPTIGFVYDARPWTA